MNRFPVRPDPSFKRRYRSAIGWRWLWFMASAAAFFAPLPAGLSGFAFWFGVASLAAALVSIGVAAWRVLLDYRCPACGRALRKPLLAYWEDPWLMFDCTACGIRWETGLHW